MTKTHCWALTPRLRAWLGETLLVVLTGVLISGCSGSVGNSPSTANESATGAAARDPSAGQSTSGQDTGLWLVDSVKDELTDDVNVFARLDSTTGRSLSQDPYTLLYRCAGSEIELYIAWGTYLGLDTTQVSLRFDDGPVKTVFGYVSNDSTATFLLDGGLPTFLRLSRKLVVRVTPYNEDPITAVFDVTGARAAMQQVEDACSSS